MGLRPNLAANPFLIHDADGYRHPVAKISFRLRGRQTDRGIRIIGK